MLENDCVGAAQLEVTKQTITKHPTTASLLAQPLVPLINPKILIRF